MSIIPAILLFIVGVPVSIIGLIALFSALILLLPEPVQQARANLEVHPWRSIFLGFLNLFGAGLILALLQTLSNQLWELRGVFNVVTALFAIYLAIPSLIGLSAVILVTGARLGATRRPFFTSLRGGGLLLLACLTPIVGWFVFSPLVLAASIGSVIGILAKPRTPRTDPVMKEKKQKPVEASKPSA
ncbi:MAG TPA: hypothetical protein VMC09_07735 [Anaerolineales bacterium]|nr:hypothetical protein [Anaerolineales bacterium]